MFQYYWMIWSTALRARLEPLRREPEAGEITTTVLVIALFAIATIIIVGVITAKILAKANSIDLQ
jgi:hypothetical protein